MNIEDSYEGAVRRLQRLEMAGLSMPSGESEATDEIADESADRMQQLEQLATLACEDNERLKTEFGIALQELDGARRELDSARAEIARAHHELGEARLEVDQLRGYVAALEQMLPSAQEGAASQAPQAVAPVVEPSASPPSLSDASPFAASSFAPSPFATELPPDEDYGYPPKSSGKGPKYFFVVAIAGAAIVALFAMRPWDRPQVAPVVAEPLTPPPLVTAPPVAKVEPTLPKVAPAVPTVVPTVPKMEQVAVTRRVAHATKTRAERKHPHHAAKKHGSAKADTAAPGQTNDPLGGTGL
jgi:hypothetical protein